MTDGDGGMIISYIESSGALRAVRIAGDGTLPWTESETLIAGSAVTTTKPPVVVGDEAGGAFIAWVSTSPADIRVQRVSAEGDKLFGEGGSTASASRGTEGGLAMINDGTGGVVITYEVSSSFVLNLRMQRLDGQGNSQFQIGGNNYLNITPGVKSSMAVVNSRPLVIYENNGGLFSRVIEFSDALPIYFTNIEVLPNEQINLTLGGGNPGTSYDILRATDLDSALSSDSWSVVGTAKPGESWIDTDPPLATAFYGAKDSEP